LFECDYRLTYGKTLKDYGFTWG